MTRRLSHLVRWAGGALMIAALLAPQAGGLRAVARAIRQPAGSEKPALRVVPGGLITESVRAEAEAGATEEAPVVDETACPKLESQLEQLYESAVLGTGRELATFAGQRHIDLEAGTARVILEMDIDPEAYQAGPAWIETIVLGAGQTTQVEHAPPIGIRAGLRSAIEATGATYETAYESWVQVLAPFGGLVALSEISGVRYVRLPFPARTLEMPVARQPAGASPAGGAPEAGNDDSEGVSLTNADDWILQGYDGSGVNLAVFDFGFTGYAGLQASGDLPSGPNTVAKDYSTSYAFGQEDPYGDYDHGSACSEIAHDMAPGAKMYLYAFGTDAEFGNAMADYETNAGITGKKVASMSIGWVNAGPYDGTGSIDTIVNTAANTYSIFFANAAGNDQRSHHSWTSMQYSAGDNITFGGSDQYEEFGASSGSWWNIPSGYVIDVFLEWNDWNANRDGNVNERDYDLYLERSKNGVAWSAATSSTTRQCNTTNPPVEQISYTATSGYTYYRLYILRYQATGCTNSFGHWMDLYSWVNTGASNLWYHYNYCNSLTIPADADGAVAAGAIFWGDDADSGMGYGLEPFSSLGPRNASGGGNNGTTVAKIDVVAPDLVSTVTYGASDGVDYASGGSGFGGTSGATPHVAGLAATAWQAFPSYTLSQIRSYVQGQALDRVAGSCGGTAALNNTYGDGRINLAATAPSVMTWTGATSADWNTASNWNHSGVPLGYCGTNVLIPTSPSGGRFPALTAESWVKDITIQTGATLNGGSQTLHVCGNWANSGTFTGSTGTVNFMGTTTVSGGSANNNFNNVTISPGKSLSLSNQTLNVSGNWTDNGSTLTPGTSTVSFSKAGSQTISTYALGSYTSLLSESFTSTTFPPTGWTQADTYGTLGAWARYTTLYYDTPASAMFNSYDYSGVATRLYKTAALNLTGYYNSRSTFYMYHDTTYTNGDFVQVEVSTDGGTTFNDVGDPIYRYTGSTGWTQHTVDLSTYDNTSSVIVAFEGVSGYGSNCYIDVVKVEGKTLSIAGSTFYSLAVATGSTTASSHNVMVSHDLTINPNATLDVGTYKVLSVGGTFTYLEGVLADYETQSIGTPEVTFKDGRTVDTAKLTKTAGTNGNATVTTHMGYIFTASEFGSTCAATGMAVLRHYNIVPALSGWTATVSLHYEDVELNGNTEASLKVYHCTGGSWHVQGTASVNTTTNWVTVTGVNDFSPFILASGTPTSVELKRFEAWPEGAAIHVQWETSQEVDNLGFNLYRSGTRNGPRTKLNQALIPSQVPPGSPYGAVYDWIDSWRVRAGHNYFYWVEDVDVAGYATMHGPVKVKMP
jgi:hypothetical protein